MKDLSSYKCPCCGAALRFDGAQQKLKCDSCENTYETEQLEQFRDIETESGKEDSFQWEEYKGQSLDGTVTYVCPSCGGEVIGDANTAVTKCPYCDNPVVIDSKLSGALKPDCVLPFVLSKQDAKKALTDFCKGKKLLPNSFTAENHLEAITGIYVPFWLFDCDARLKITFDATRIRTWSDSNYIYTKTDYYKIFRDGCMSFRSVPVDGSSRLDDSLMDSIEPFDYSKAEEFGTAFLPGFFADKYDVDAAESRKRADERVTNSTVKALTETVIGYNSVTASTKSMSTSGAKTRYALMPVWMLNTKYRDKIYTFAVNGQTGRVSGNLPIDMGKYWCRMLCAAAVALVSLVLIMLFFGGLL